MVLKNRRLRNQKRRSYQGNRNPKLDKIARELDEATLKDTGILCPGCNKYWSKVDMDASMELGLCPPCSLDFTLYGDDIEPDEWYLKVKAKLDSIFGPVAQR